MKTLTIKILCAAFIFWGLAANAQKLTETTVELTSSKMAKKKGMYVETTLTEDGNIRSFVAYDLKKGELGFDVFTLNMDGKLIETASEVANPETEKKYNVSIPDPDKVENPGQGVKVLRLVTANGVLGKLNIEEGYFEPKYATSKEYGPYLTTYTQVLRGFKFEETESNKSDMRLNIFASHCAAGDDLEKSYTILEGLIPNTIGYFKSDAVIAFLGKDIRVDLKNPKGSNYLVTGQFDGKTKSFLNIKEHTLDYNVCNVTTGWDGKGNRSFLVSTLNAPTSSAELNKTQAKGHPYMSYLTMDTVGNLIDNVTFDSKSVRGNFGVYGSGDAHYIFGNINAKHDGYYRFDVGTPTDFQIVKIEGGKVVEQKVMSMDELENIAVTPDGKKTKLKYKDIQYHWYHTLENGDIIAFAQTPKNYLIYQIGSDANMKALYVYDRLEGIGHSMSLKEIDGQLYLLYRTQSGEMVQGLKKNISKGSGYMKNTNFSRVDELTTFGRLVKIDPESLSCSEPLDYNSDVILGTDPMFESSTGGVILPVRDKKRDYKYSVVN